MIFEDWWENFGKNFDSKDYIRQKLAAEVAWETCLKEGKSRMSDKDEIKKLKAKIETMRLGLDAAESLIFQHNDSVTVRDKTYTFYKALICSKEA